MKHLPWYTFTSVGVLIMTKANALKKKKKRKGGNKPCRPMFIGSLVWILLNMSSDFQFVNQKGAFFSNMSLVWSLMHKIVHACQACMLLCATAPLKGRVLHTSGEQSLQGRGHSSKQRVGLATKVQVWDKITWYCSVLTIFMWLKGILSFGVELFRKYNLGKKKKHNSIWKPNWFVFLSCIWCHSAQKWQSQTAEWSISMTSGTWQGEQKGRQKPGDASTKPTRSVDPLEVLHLLDFVTESC